MIDEISNVVATESCFEHSVVAFDILGVYPFRACYFGECSWSLLRIVKLEM